MLIPNPILLDVTPAGGLILPVVAGRGGLGGYVLLGLSGPDVTAELSGDGGETWSALTYPHTLSAGEELRLIRSDTSARLSTLRALAPVDEDAPPEGGGETAEPFTVESDAQGYQTITNATATADASGYQTIQDATATADADGYETVERG